MRFADYLKRSMDRLTADAWEQLLTGDAAVRPTAKTVLTTCPCCRSTVTIELAVAMLPVTAPATTDDESCSQAMHDTQLDLQPVSAADLVLA